MKIQKKIGGGGGQGGGRSGGSGEGSGWGVQGGCDEELKFCENSKKEKLGGVRGGRLGGVG